MALDLTTLSLVFVVVVAVWLSDLVLRDPLQGFPGPFAARLTNLWQLSVFFSGKQHLVYHGLHKKYGSVVRTGPNTLLFNDAASLQTIYGFNSRIEKGDFYLMSGLAKEPNVFQERTDADHKRKRKDVVPIAFARQKVTEYLQQTRPFVDTWIKSLLPRLEKAQDGALDILPNTKHLFNDSIMQASYGCPAGYLEAGTDVQESLAAKDMAIKMGFGVPLVPNLARFFLWNPLKQATLLKPRFDKSGQPSQITWLSSITEGRVESIIADPNLSPPCITKSLVEVPASDKRKLRHRADLHRETLNFMFAGTGSSLAATTFALHMLGKHPSWQTQIRDAIDQNKDNGLDLWDIPVLQAFLKETWRLNPPFQGVFERIVGPGPPLLIGEMKEPLPAGTRIGCSMYTIMRSETTFGPDASVFKPERWLKDFDPEYLKNINDAWSVFGRGSRACPGKELAQGIICETIAKFLNTFEAGSLDEKLEYVNAFEAQHEALNMKLNPR